MVLEVGICKPLLTCCCQHALRPNNLVCVFRRKKRQDDREKMSSESQPESHRNKRRRWNRYGVLTRKVLQTKMVEFENSVDPDEVAHYDLCLHCLSSGL